MINTPLDFDTTMLGLERGLTVMEIATFKLFRCGLLDSVADLRAKFQPIGIDYLPVADQDRIVGVLDLASAAVDKTVPEAMLPLSEDMLVSSNDPISDVLGLLRDCHFRLVVRGGRIDGIVTLSDLHKLPVRVLAFTQVSHLEMLMGAIIKSKCRTEEEWTSRLSECRLKKAKAKQEDLKSKRVDPPLLECTDFCDKRDMVRKILKLPRGFTKDLKKVESLRNQVAHAAGHGDGPDASKDFISQLMLTADWITHLRKYLEQLSTDETPSTETGFDVAPAQPAP